jgi:hypothetical protein
MPQDGPTPIAVALKKIYPDQEIPEDYRIEDDHDPSSWLRNKAESLYDTEPELMIADVAKKVDDSAPIETMAPQDPGSLAIKNTDSLKFNEDALEKMENEYKEAEVEKHK